MCTIIALHQVHPEYPLIIAANRDEYYARPATGLQVLAAGPPAIVGGYDERGGGTWMGVTAAGFFAGLTNQRSAQPGDAGGGPALRSRGEVVLAVLRAGGVAAADDYLRQLTPGDYGSFNLLYGDGRELRVAYGRRLAAAVEVVDLTAAPGVMVLANDRLGSPHFPKAARAQARAAALVVPKPPPFPRLVEPLRRILGSHRLPPLPLSLPDGSMPVLSDGVRRKLQALCIHLPQYGTRSASVIALRPGKVAHYLHSAGPPCRAPLVSQTALIS